MKPTYSTYAKNGKLVFHLNGGQFDGVEYVYESMNLNGGLNYKVRTKKNLVNESNKILFENTIRNIIKDKLSKI